MRKPWTPQVSPGPLASRPLQPALRTRLGVLGPPKLHALKRRRGSEVQDESFALIAFENDYDSPVGVSFSLLRSLIQTPLVTARGSSIQPRKPFSSNHRATWGAGDEGCV